MYVHLNMTKLFPTYAISINSRSGCIIKVQTADTRTTVHTSVRADVWVLFFRQPKYIEMQKKYLRDAQKALVEIVLKFIGGFLQIVLKLSSVSYKQEDIEVQTPTQVSIETIVLKILHNLGSKKTKTH